MYTSFTCIYVYTCKHWIIYMYIIKMLTLQIPDLTKCNFTTDREVYPFCAPCIHIPK